MNREGDSMALCSRCPKHPPMILKGNRFVCLDCGWSYDKPVHIRTYPELLVENVQLKKEIEKLKKKIEKLTGC